MARLKHYIETTVLPFVRSKVIPVDRRIRLKPGQSAITIWKQARKRMTSVLANVHAETTAITDDKLKAQIPYGLLVKNQQGQWRILAVDKTTVGSQKVKSIEIIPQGQYAFVRTQQGFIRVKPIAGDANHRLLSDHADRVRYAGMLYFGKDVTGEVLLEAWENASGGYQPEASRSSFAGLPKGSFRPLQDVKQAASPVIQSPSTPTLPSDKGLFTPKLPTATLSSERVTFNLATGLTISG